MDVIFIRKDSNSNSYVERWKNKFEYCNIPIKYIKFDITKNTPKYEKLIEAINEETTQAASRRIGQTDRTGT